MESLQLGILATGVRANFTGNVCEVYFLGTPGKAERLQSVHMTGLTMRNDEEKKKWKRTAQLWAQRFKPANSIKDHACTSAKYKACESMLDNTICFISKDSFTRMDETTRLGVGGAGRTHRVGVVDEELVQVLGSHEVVHYCIEKRETRRFTRSVFVR
ncbi:hypothetical protein R1sor_018690 [Riccia sorocarpa]|uniref:Uncharacterized protein n=1 Tax=Riccia sorocarpa TaxID=122646 RepID=A0ABD3IAH7_9MARC